MGEGWPNRGEWVGLWRGIRTEHYVLAKWFDKSERNCLFYRKNDPFEMNNLYNNEKYKDLQLQMENRLNELIEQTDDPFYTGSRSTYDNVLELGQKFIHSRYLEKRNN